MTTPTTHRTKGSRWQQTLGRFAFRVLRITGVIYLGFTLYLLIFQRRIIYYPSHAAEEALQAMATAHGLAAWTDDDGSILGWREAQRPVGPTDVILCFHGNAGYALHRLYFVNGFTETVDPPLDVHIMEYPGYGARAGTPSRVAFQQAAREALKQLRAEVTDARIFLAGESLGSAVAAELAAEFPDDVDGILMITPFTRLEDVAKHHYRLMPVRTFLRERYAPVDALKSYQGPVAFMVAARDEIVPATLGKALYQTYEGPKRLWLQEDSTHNAFDYHSRSPWWQEVVTFLRDQH